MNIAVLLGNGFDLQLGLNTSYKSFCEDYVKIKSNDDYINKIKNDIANNIDKWSDLEQKVGKISSEYFGEDDNGLRDFYKFYNDISDHLQNFIKNESNRIGAQNGTIARDELIDRVKHFYEFTSDSIKRQINLVNFAPNKIDFLIFNYTRSIDTIFNNSPFIKRDVFADYDEFYANYHHIHGYYDEDMIFGVNDNLQIANKYIRDKSMITGSLVKSKVNKLLNNGREEIFSDIISKANYIIVYGMSLGETDKNRWIEILKRLESNDKTMLVIFAKEKGFNPAKSYQWFDKVDEWKKRLLSYKEINENIKTRVLNQINICFTLKIFNNMPLYVKPPYKKATITVLNK